MTNSDNSTRILKKPSRVTQPIDSWVSELYDDAKRPQPQTDSVSSTAQPTAPAINESGGPRGKEPTRYGDWEKAGRCIDF